jgi:hypothetical protein
MYVQLTALAFEKEIVVDALRFRHSKIAELPWSRKHPLHDQSHHEHCRLAQHRESWFRRRKRILKTERYVKHMPSWYVCCRRRVMFVGRNNAQGVALHKAHFEGSLVWYNKRPVVRGLSHEFVIFSLCLIQRGHMKTLKKAWRSSSSVVFWAVGYTDTWFRPFLVVPISWLICWITSSNI